MGDQSECLFVTTTYNNTLYNVIVTMTTTQSVCVLQQMDSETKSTQNHTLRHTHT